MLLKYLEQRAQLLALAVRLWQREKVQVLEQIFLWGVRKLVVRSRACGRALSKAGSRPGSVAQSSGPGLSSGSGSGSSSLGCEAAAG